MEQKENREEFRQLSRQETAAVPSPPPPPFPFSSFDFEKKTTTSLNLISLFWVWVGGGRREPHFFLAAETQIRRRFAHVEYCRQANLIFVMVPPCTNVILSWAHKSWPNIGCLLLISFISVDTLPFQDFLNFFSFLFFIYISPIQN